MKIRILTAGKAPGPAIASLIKDYEKRLKRWANIESASLPVGKSADEESSAMLKRINDLDYVILLDETGHQKSTPEMAAEAEKWLSSGRQIVFVIGGAYGVNYAVKARADYIWSFSRQVFPHQLMRVLLIEQLYRLMDFRAGGHYHHN